MVGGVFTSYTYDFISLFCCFQFIFTFITVYIFMNLWFVRKFEIIINRIFYGMKYGFPLVDIKFLIAI